MQNKSTCDTFHTRPVATINLPTRSNNASLIKYNDLNDILHFTKEKKIENSEYESPISFCIVNFTVAKFLTIITISKRHMVRTDQQIHCEKRSKTIKIGYFSIENFTIRYDLLIIFNSSINFGRIVPKLAVR